MFILPSPGGDYDVDVFVTVARKAMERDGLTPALIMTTGLQHPKVPQAATDYAYPGPTA
jgi:hypothetical protein